MKRFPLLMVLIALSLCLFAQRRRTSFHSVNTVSYPYMPLAGETYRINAHGLNHIEQYGLTIEFIDSLFKKTEKLKLVDAIETDYLVEIWFQAASIANVKLVSNTSTSFVSHQMEADLKMPISLQITNKDGYLIVPKYNCFESLKIYGKKCNTEPEARAAWNIDMEKNRSATIKSNLIKALKQAVPQFQYNHDVFTEKLQFEVYTLKTSKKFTDDSWEKAATQIEQLFTRVMPGQSLADYRSEVMPLIEFYNSKFEEHLSDPKEYKEFLLTIVSNICFLKVLIADFEGLEKYAESPESSWIMRSAISSVVSGHKPYVEKYNKTYPKFKSGYSIDAERIELCKQQANADSIKSEQNALTDSLRTRPSLVKIYYKNNGVFEGKAYINPYRTYLPKGGIYDLDHGKYVTCCAMDNEQMMVMRVLPDDVIKIEAGKETLYPFMEKGDNISKFAMLAHETPHLRLLSFRSTFFIQKIGSGEVMAYGGSILAQTTRKKMAEFFSDDAQLSERILNKEFPIEKLADLCEVLDLYKKGQ